MAMPPKIMVTGDWGWEQYVLIETLRNKPASLRDTWVEATNFEIAMVRGGAGQLVECLGEEVASLVGEAHERLDRGEAEPPEGAPESIYLLTKQDRRKRKEGEADSKPVPDPDACLDEDWTGVPAEDRGRDQVWKIGLAIPAGEKCRGCVPVPLTEFAGDDTPVAVLDFRQGWLRENQEWLPTLLAGRRFLVRTHDPVAGPPEFPDLWQRVRGAKTGGRGVWFCPSQDLAQGSLRMPGAWQTQRHRILEYLCDDPTLWDEKEGWHDAVVVQIENDGALVLGPGNEPPGREGTLLVFPGDQPGSFAQRVAGDVLGAGIIMAATLCHVLGGELTHSELVWWTQRALVCVRRLLRRGYRQEDIKRGVLFPRSSLAKPEIAEADLPIPYEPPAPTLDSAIGLLKATDREYSESVVYTLGRFEICNQEFAEELLVTRHRIAKHVSSGEGVLSFAVFGGPGSGKSTLVSQLQESIGGALKGLTFNVSQFTSPDHLRDKLLEVQSWSLQGKIPFVQWDEFDCLWDGRQGGWVSRFLMPMQDAAFWDGHSQRSLGKCVFAFIGGTWPSDTEFRRWTERLANVPYKVRDFHSRLERVLSVPPVDPQGTSGRDCYLLNRAVAIRRELARTGVKQLHHGVMMLLLTARLRHGMRSLQTIIRSSALDRTTTFEPRHLPPLNVLEQHLRDAEAALTMVARDTEPSVAFRQGK